MLKLPLEFTSEAQATGHFEKSWPVTSGEHQAICSIPSEFGGCGNGFSPEDFFLQAIINCFVGTFKVYAESSKIIFNSLHVKGRLTVDLDSSRKVSMKKVCLDIKIYGVSRPDRIETIVSKVFRDGFILNSVKSEIVHNLEILESADSPILNSN